METGVLIGAPAVTEMELERGSGPEGKDLRLHHRERNPLLMSLQLRRGRRSWTPSSPAPEERTFPRPSCAWCRPKSPTRAGQELDSFEGKSESDTFKGSCWCVIGHLTDFFRIYLFIYFVQPSWHGPKCNVSWRLKWFCRPTAKLFLANTFPSWIFRHITFISLVLFPPGQEHVLKLEAIVESVLA